MNLYILPFKYSEESFGSCLPSSFYLMLAWSSSILFKTEFGVSSPDTCWRGCFFSVFLIKKSKFYLEIVIFSWVVDFFEIILAFSLKQDLVYSHQPLAEEWLFFEFLIRKEPFVAEENLGLHKRELLKYHLFLFYFVRGVCQ